MELDVDLGIFVELARAASPFSNFANILRSVRDFVVVRVLRDQARRHALERGPGGDHLDHLLLGLAHHIDAAARHRAHEALALELRHRLAHRRAADAEILRELALVEPDLAAAARRCRARR